MKTAAIILLVLVLAIGGCLYYGVNHTRLLLTGKSLQVLPAGERPAQFETLKESLEQNTLLGTPLKKGPLGDKENYTYYVYTLRLKNPGLVPAEMVEIQIAPTDPDVLFYSDTQETVIRPGQTRDIWCTLLTEGAPPAARDIYITYYLWGHPMEMRYAYAD